MARPDCALKSTAREVAACTTLFPGVVKFCSLADQPPWVVALALAFARALSALILGPKGPAITP